MNSNSLKTAKTSFKDCLTEKASHSATAVPSKFCLPGERSLLDTTKSSIMSLRTYFWPVTLYTNISNKTKYNFFFLWAVYLSAGFHFRKIIQIIWIWKTAEFYDISAWSPSSSEIVRELMVSAWRPNSYRLLHRNTCPLQLSNLFWLSYLC